MSSTGQADVVYRVVERNARADRSGAPRRRRRSRCASHTSTASAGSTSARSTATPASRCVRRPQANAPQIAIGPTGNGVVVWQEPEIDGVARIWARRLFGASLDYVMPVSATSFDGAPIEEDAEAPSVAFSRLGQAEVAYRQGRPRLAAAGTADLPEHPARRRIGERRRIPGRVRRGPERLRRQAAKSDARASTSTNSDVRLLYDANGRTPCGRGHRPRPHRDADAGPAVGRAEALPRLSELPAGERDEPGRRWRLGVAERRPRGRPAVACARTFPAAACRPGWSAAAPAARSANWPSGARASATGSSPSSRARSATRRSSPRRSARRRRGSSSDVPKGWLKPAQAQISWEPAASANGPLTLHGGARRPRTRARLARHVLHVQPDELGSGVARGAVARHRRLRADAHTADAAAHRRAATDRQDRARRRRPRRGRARQRHASRGRTAAVTVTFGDGQRARQEAGAPPLRQPGAYTIVVHVRDTRQRRASSTAGEGAMSARCRRLIACSVGAARSRWRAGSRARRAQTCSGRSVAGVGYAASNRPTTRTTRRSPATVATSSSTARWRAHGGVATRTRETASSNREGGRRGRRRATLSCRRSAQTASTSASRPTKAALIPERTANDRRPDVYVADCRSPNVAPCEEGSGPSTPCAFKLVSAVNGSRRTPDLRIPGRSEDREKSKNGDYGAEAAGRSAISADGRKVAFVTTAPSNLDGHRDAGARGGGQGSRNRHDRSRQRRVRPRDRQAAIDGERGVPSRSRRRDATVELRRRLQRRPTTELRARPSRIRVDAPGALDQRRRIDGRMAGPGRRRAGADAFRRIARAQIRRAAVAADRRRAAGADAAGDAAARIPTNPACVASGETAAAARTRRCRTPARDRSGPNRRIRRLERPARRRSRRAAAAQRRWLHGRVHRHRAADLAGQRLRRSAQASTRATTCTWRTCTKVSPASRRCAR